MPTFETTARFKRDFVNLDRQARRQFQQCVRMEFIPALRDGPPFPRNLNIKAVQGASGIYEMAWGPNGRATYEYGERIEPDKLHIVWRRVGTHGIFKRP